VEADAPVKAPAKAKPRVKTPNGTWPKWYWDLTVAPTNDRVAFGELDLTTKKSVAPLLLRLQWQGFPLILSRNYRWLYRIPKSQYTIEKTKKNDSRGPPVEFDPKKKGDEVFADDKKHVYFRLPHKDGEGHNVGNPLSKSFVKPIESGELSSAAAEDGDEAAAKAASSATNMNVLCSYWMSSRERIMDQMVVYQNGDRSKGMILPQVITMGTVTRRAVEATWLTASNAKKNRVGSELKAMVRAPPGYSIVGADVDSEELWIASVMGDSQFGLHGATAIGWMTLEGTKSAGTDLHSKTASILSISRDSAKVFNYSRIYGAGKKHAVQLLLQGDSTLTKEKAAKRADKLYEATKGSRAFRLKSQAPAAVSSLWYGGSESFLFNTLEAIALSDRPTTPALGCGVTRALRKTYLEDASSYLPSRINWVVQSSGVDYLHLLIVSMEYLISKYDIKARYLLSVHDEVRYLAEEGDRYRTAMALQIANAWTRALFSYNLGIDDLPQGVAFFSAVDIDHVLRKEVFMTCETPSHPRPIPAGESLDIEQLLAKTNGGSLGPIIKPTDLEVEAGDIHKQAPVALFGDITSSKHQMFLKAQAASTPTPPKRWLESQTPLRTDIPWTPPPTKPRAARKRKIVERKIEEQVDHEAGRDGGGHNDMTAADWEAVWEDSRKSATG
jgi:DNA polymerase gamma 1